MANEDLDQLPLAELAAAVHAIKAQVVACRLPCDGIEHDDINFPRGLQLEVDGRSGPGIAIVGINPGRNGGMETEFYQEHGATARALEEWFKGMPDRYL